MQKLVILDFEKGEVHTYSIKDSIDGLMYESIMKLLELFGHKEDSCQWMVINSDEYIINH